MPSITPSSLIMARFSIVPKILYRQWSHSEDTTCVEALSCHDERSIRKIYGPVLALFH
jgi:hypothetical protein